MRHVQRSYNFAVMVIVLLAMLSADRNAVAQADPANAPSLTISQFKVTSSSGQFITLYNATDTPLDISKYQLEYFNNYDLTKATSSKLIALSGNVPPHGYYMISDDVVPLCYQMTVDSAALGLSSTTGFIELVLFGQASPGGSVTPVLQDYVGWTKSVTAGAVTLPSTANGSLLRQPLDSSGHPTVAAAGSGTWLAVQPAADNACNLSSIASGAPLTQTNAGGLLPGTEPPASIESLVSDESGPTSPSLPSGDIGLLAPSITELLPNPAGTGNDATDEFIEIYNPNASGFDLSGFILQTGTTRPHTYVFPPGTMLLGKGYKAFYSAQTSLSLSNSGGQAQLLDPMGNSVAHSDPYGTAKDGQVWALAKGKWYWSVKPTPGASNVVSQASNSQSKAKSGKTAATKTAAAVKGAGTAFSSSADSVAPTTPIHFWTLAAIAAGALLYGAYEYRADLANRIYELRRNLGAGARHWPALPWRRSNRAS